MQINTMNDDNNLIHKTLHFNRKVKTIGKTMYVK